MPLPPKSEDDLPASGDDAGAKPAKRGRLRTRRPESEADVPPSAAQVAVFVPEPAPALETAPAPAAPPEATPAASQGPAPEDGAWEHRDSAADTGGGDGRQGGGHGEWQDRNSWKRNKRKRGRHGGHWQPGPAGGQASHYPP